jgi:hypothetical protein
LLLVLIDFGRTLERAYARAVLTVSVRMSVRTELRSPPEDAALNVGTISLSELRVEPGRGSEFWLPAFYINRDCDDDRRAAVELELCNADLAAERICGVDGLSVPPDLRKYFFDADRLVSRLRPGEVGCYASHLKALSLIVERELEYALVLEDDARLPRDLTQTIKTILTTLPKEWDFVHLCGDVSRSAASTLPTKTVPGS